MQSTLLTIATVVRNARGTIDRCVHSVIEQTSDDFEYIIIDGMSNDGTSEILAKINHPAIRLIREPDTGVYDAMNKAVRLAHGQYIAFLNADDYYLSSNILNHVSGLIKAAPHIDILAGSIEFFSERASQTFISTPTFNPSEKHVYFPHPSTFVRTGMMKAAGAFNTDYKISADCDLFYRLFLGSTIRPEFMFLSTPFSRYSLNGLSGSLSFKQIHETFKIERQYRGLARALSGMTYHFLKKARRWQIAVLNHIRG